MKRSEINQLILEADAFIHQFGFYLPPFAHWTLSDWQRLGTAAQQIKDRNLGWDITDFGLGQYAQKGVLLFTIRNGTLEELAAGHGQVYCEKVLLCQPEQLVLHHFHYRKTEDIINRGGGQLEITLYQADDNYQITNADIRVNCDGLWHTVPAGGSILLEPGQSITLQPLQYHQFKAKKAPVLVGEVSTVNDDHTDNHFLEPVGRFPSIEEDVAPVRLLVEDYSRLL